MHSVVLNGKILVNRGQSYNLTRIRKREKWRQYQVQRLDGTEKRNRTSKLNKCKINEKSFVYSFDAFI